MDQVNLAAWENRTEVRTGELGLQMAHMAQATLGDTAYPLKTGDVMPQLWHWFAFLPTTQTEDLGTDGHPPLGDFMPPVRLDRRMWAGGKLHFHRDLHVGEALSRQSTIRSVTEKEGAAGRLVFVTIDHEISGEDGVAISERQDIVYLAIPDRYAPPHKQPVGASPEFEELVLTSPTLLFRYSALTFNAHRIHYDLPYAQEVEHYPGLVVHGPLQATMLIDAAARHAGQTPDHFSFRGVHPVFAAQETRVMGYRDDERTMSLCTAVTADGTTYQGMQANAIWEEQI